MQISYRWCMLSALSLLRWFLMALGAQCALLLKQNQPGLRDLKASLVCGFVHTRASFSPVELPEPATLCSAREHSVKRCRLDFRTTPWQGRWPVAPSRSTCSACVPITSGPMGTSLRH